ncbi:aspartate aminotransferase-like enzyme [Streptomyces filamentosus]
MAILWNTRVGVIANLEADSPDQALAALRRALARAGFDVFEEDGDAFEAEEGTAVTELPLVVRLSPR